MKIWTRPIYIHLSLKTLLIVLLISGLLIAGFVLYKNYVFHNWFFQTLSVEKIEAIYVYNSYEREKSLLSQHETENVVLFLRNIHIKEEPYKNYALIGNHGNAYHIQLKNGISFDLNLSGGDPGVYIIDGDGYSIGYRDEPGTAEAFENLWHFEELHREHIEKYYP